MILEIEDYQGNTIGAVSLSVNKNGEIEIDNITGFSVADVEDFDYIFGTTDMVTRIQHERMSDEEQAEYEAEQLEKMIRDTLPDDELF